MTKIFYMIRKEFLQIFRTREMVAILFIMPVIQMVVLGFAVTNEVKHITLIIADRDNSRLSREIVAAFSNTDRFDITGRETDVREIGLDIHRWKAQAALIIPNHFGRDFRRGLRPDIQMIVDGLDGNAAGVSVGYAGGILREWAEAQARQTPRLAMVKQNTPQLELIERLWYNL
ncbi:MAG TPA: ABC transporter permease, partial [Calditrichia bacterium]|nr:ABC transporter permease [Calditrichia bacterium]